MQSLTLPCPPVLLSKSIIAAFGEGIFASFEKTTHEQITFNLKKIRGSKSNISVWCPTVNLHYIKVMKIQVCASINIKSQSSLEMSKLTFFNNLKENMKQMTAVASFFSVSSFWNVGGKRGIPWENPHRHMENNRRTKTNKESRQNSHPSYPMLCDCLITPWEVSTNITFPQLSNVILTFCTLITMHLIPNLQTAVELWFFFLFCI